MMVTMMVVMMMMIMMAVNPFRDRGRNRGRRRRRRQIRQQGENTGCRLIGHSLFRSCDQRQRVFRVDGLAAGATPRSKRAR